MVFENLTATQTELVIQGAAVRLEKQRHAAPAAPQRLDNGDTTLAELDSVFGATTPSPRYVFIPLVTALADLVAGQGDARQRAMNAMRKMGESGQFLAGDLCFAAPRGRRSAPARGQGVFSMRRC